LALLAVSPLLAAEGRTPVYLAGTLIGADGRYILTRNITGGGGIPVITIAAANVDLDLNGFTIFAGPASPGIELPPGVPQDVKIHNGTIVGGVVGIIRHPGPPSQRLVIEDMRLRDQTGDGIAIFDTVETVHIRRTSIRKTGASGIILIGAAFTNGSIEHCSIKETGADGILIDTAAAFEISHYNLEVPGAGAGFSGIVLVKCVGVLLNQNVISDPGLYGIDLKSSKGNKLNNNVIRHAFKTGIHVDSASGDNLILDNIATDCGFDLPPGHGIHVEGFQNHIHGNTFNSNFSCGMLFDGASFLNTFGRNMARGNGAGGGCALPCFTLFPPDSCDLSGAMNDTSLENMIPGLF
jgi:parallel beta-helix repeat protein